MRSSRQGSTAEFTPLVLAQKTTSSPVPSTASARPDTVQAVQVSVQSEVAPGDADLALDLIESGVTTQPVETLIAVLTARRGGLSINAAAKVVGINYRTSQRIVAAGAEHRQQLMAVG
jgi:hypothetical protein